MGTPAVPATAGRTSVSQINLQHCKAATALLCRDLARLQTDISLIQEPWIHRGLVKGISTDLGSLIYASAEPGPRACLFVNKRHGALKLNQFCTRDLAAATIRTRMGGVTTELVIASAYLPYDSEDPPPTRELRELVDYCKNKGLHLVVGCDANSHHAIWGSSNTNERGTALLEYLSTTDLEILNRGSKPTFVTSRRQEVIDLTMGSPRVTQAIVNWQVSEEDTLSDHRLITFDLAGNDSQVPTETYRNPRTADWPSFQAGLRSRLGDTCGWPRTEGAIEREAGLLQTALVQSFEAACPLRRRKNNKKVAWWNGELNKFRSLSRRLLNKALRTKTENDWDAYRKAQKEYKKLVKKSKEAAWRRFCGEIEALPLVARLRKVFASGPPNKLEGLTLPDGRITENHEEVLAHLFEVHFPGSELTDREQPQTDALSIKKPGDWVTAAKAVTLSRIDWAIKTFDRYKSPGVDGIFPALLQEGGELIIRRLNRIFRSCLALRYVPKAWREVRVVFIPKPGKSSYDQAKSFRPISLTSFLLKTLERLVDRYIREGALVERPVQTSQHAYQAGKSVETALHCIVKDIERTLSRKESALCVFLDVEGAFDNTSFDAICDAAREFRVDESLIEWIHLMLRTRTVTAGLRGSTARAHVKRGCPQGGVLSPLLWTMVVDGLLAALDGLGVNVVGYADDIMIMIRGTHAAEMTWRMQRALLLMQEWCTSKSLRVNPSKTEMVLFTRRRGSKPNPPYIFGTELQYSSEVRYLGVTLDSKLSWKSHIAKQASKATATFWACRRMFGQTWGLKPGMVKWIYTAILVPQLTYASLVWWPALQRATNRKTLDKVLRLVGLGITGAMRTTPTLAMGALLDMAPPHIIAEANAKNAALRLHFSGKWRRAEAGHASLLQRDGDLDGILAQGGDCCDRFYHFDHNYQVLYPSRQEWMEDQSKLLSPGGLVWYTDGSKTGAGAGAGIWSSGPKTRLSLALGHTASVLQAEVYAIWTCARLILDKGYSGKHIYICSDSRAAIGSLHHVVKKSGLVLDCNALLSQVACRNTVKVLWVPGHAGIQGNEEANTLARAGATVTDPARFCHVPIAMDHIRTLSKRWVEERFTDLWLRTEGMGHSRAIFKGPSGKLGSILIDLDRHQLRAVVGLVTGHWHTGKHLRRLGLSDEPLCLRCKEEEETPLHVITRCRALEDIRRNVLGAPVLESLDLEEVGVRVLLHFAKEARLTNNPT